MDYLNINRFGTTDIYVCGGVQFPATVQHYLFTLQLLIMKKVYVIAHTCEDTGLTIEHFFSPHKTVKRLSELADFDEKPNPDDDPKQYISAYYEWIREENDNICVTDIALEVIDI